MGMAKKKAANIGSLIYSRPDLHGGRPCLAGTGMMVRTIAVWHTYHRLSPKRILKEFPHLDLARIHAALAYYYANRREIEDDLETDRRLGEELAARFPNGWSPETDPSLRPRDPALPG